MDTTISNEYIFMAVTDLEPKKNYLITSIGKRMARSCVPYFIAEIDYTNVIKRNVYLPWNYNVKSCDMENEILYLSYENLDTYRARRSGKDIAKALGFEITKQRKEFS